MATFYLVNTVILASNKMLPGEYVDDAVDNVAAINAAGGLLWPSSDTIVAAAALVAQNAHKNRGANEIEMQAIMQAAVDKSQGTVQTGTATLVAGTVTVTGVTLASDSKIMISRNTPGGTLGVDIAAPSGSRVTGAPGTAQFVINAVDSAGALVATDTSTVDWAIL